MKDGVRFLSFVLIYWISEGKNDVVYLITVSSLLRTSVFSTLPLCYCSVFVQATLQPLAQETRQRRRETSAF